MGSVPCRQLGIGVGALELSEEASKLGDLCIQLNGSLEHGADYALHRPGWDR